MWTAMFSTKRSVHFLLLRESDFLLYVHFKITNYKYIFFSDEMKQDLPRSTYNNVRNTIREERYYD